MLKTLCMLIWGCFGVMPVVSHSETFTNDSGELVIEQVLGGLSEPWGLAFLPKQGVGVDVAVDAGAGASFLVTERGGGLLLVQGGHVQRLRGLPEVAADGQGGLLDVMVPRDFADSREVYLSFSTLQGTGAGTALGVGRMRRDGAQLDDFRVIFEMSAGSQGGRHFGSRIVEARDGTIFLTIGERGDRPAAQDLTRHNGSIIRINRDGSVPADNPFVGRDDAQPEIWSYGHRNPQGAALDSDGTLWVNEHGARGGDEVNQVRRGANYGWPVIAYGRHYSGLTIGEGSEKTGMEQPAHYWDPSIAPSGLMIYSGALWPQWRGNIFSGSLKFDYISRLDPDANWQEGWIESAQTGRVRDVREAADGSIWFLSVTDGAVYRITPAP